MRPEKLGRALARRSEEERKHEKDQQGPAV
jgi:hypothetical protein